MASDETVTLQVDAGDDAGPGTAACLVIALECNRPLAGAEAVWLRTGVVEIGRGERRGWGQRSPGEPLRVAVADEALSTRHARLEKSTAGWSLVDTGSKNGTLVNGRPVTRVELADGDLIEAGRTVFLFRDALLAPSPGAVPPPLPGLRTLDTRLASVFTELARAAASRVRVLVVGETGTGKELVARAVHELSGRSGPFVPVNCGALAESLVPSELFGHRRGAFSGAHADHDGLIRRAHGGTLFLDEVAELSERTQVALLRVLQEGEVRPVGGSEAIPVDVRVVTATHREQPDQARGGPLRDDLYARLAGLIVAMPPLADRREDIGLLVAALLERIAGPRAAGLRFQEAAARALFTYDWPLNIRELEQALERAVAVCDDQLIRLEHLPESLRTGDGGARAGERQAAQLTALLRKHQGNVTEVARELGLSRAYTHRLIKRHGIDVGALRRP